MHSIERITKINSEQQPDQQPLYWHPRIAALRLSINRLSVQDEYRRRLRAALCRYADLVIDRPHYRPEEGWDDLEALQQVTLGDWMEDSIRYCADNDR